VLYGKTEKNGLQVDITRLELVKDYSRKRTPVIVMGIEDLENEFAVLEKKVKKEAAACEKEVTNVYTPIINPLSLPLSLPQNLPLCQYKHPVTELNLYNATLDANIVEENGAIFITSSTHTFILVENTLYYSKGSESTLKALTAPLPPVTELHSYPLLLM